MMAQTVSVHNGNSGKVAQEHNARDAEYLKYHVNQEGVIPGGYYKIIVHEPEADAINRIFQMHWKNIMQRKEQMLSILAERFLIIMSI